MCSPWHDVYKWKCRLFSSTQHNNTNPACTNCDALITLSHFVDCFIFPAVKDGVSYFLFTPCTAAHGVTPTDFPVIITSYEIVIADSKFLSKYNFKYVVVDEGHRLKNFNCR